jgi:hypothetical protein
MDYNELEKLIHEKFGFKEYEFAAVEECGNDSSHEFTVDGELDEWDKETLHEWEHGNPEMEGKHFVHYSNGILLNALCFHEIIEPGEYIISVCW